MLFLKPSRDFICDRSDIEDCAIDKPYVKKFLYLIAGRHESISSNTYDLAFANFVMEHIEDENRVAFETEG